MLSLILSVLVISISGVMTPGPMFAVTVAKSYRSPWAGPKIALGHAVIEVPLILAIFFLQEKFVLPVTAQVIISLLGGGMIIWMGIGMFRTRREVVESGKDFKYNAVTAGIIMSATNPFFLLWWATVGSLLIMKFKEYGTAGLPVFIFTHWICDLIWLSIVSVVIYKTKSLWGKKFQEWVFILCSLLLLGFGAWFIVSGIKLLL